MARPAYRPDRDGTHRKAFEANRAKIFATQSVCGICGRPVDFSQRWPDPLAACVDHIVPVAKGGHPSDIANLQLAHVACNREKSDKVFAPSPGPTTTPPRITNRDLPQSRDWSTYRGEEE